MKKIYLVLLAFIAFYPMTIIAQEEKALEEAEETTSGAPTLVFGADLMSRYIWRGIDFGNSPAIQPNIAFTWQGLCVGAWGSYSISPALDYNGGLGTYAETDFYISYTHQYFTLMFFDFFLPNPYTPNFNNKYYDFDNVSTGHAVEASLSFNGTETFPMQLMVGTLIYGADKNDKGENNFSTYAEVNYNFALKSMKMNLKPFVGASFKESNWYGEKPGVINMGLTAKKELPITSVYSLPLQLSLITNPNAQTMYFVFGITF